MRGLVFALVAGLAALLSGCSTMRSYDAELYRTLDQASIGNVDGAIRLLEANNRLAEKDLLYYLELGMLQRLGARYGESQKSWMSAAARMQSLKEAEVSNFLRDASSILVGDKVRAYTGHDYEK